MIENYPVLFVVLVKKIHISLFLNLGTFGREKVIGDVPDRKLAFLDHVKKLQILHFSKGVSPWF